VILIVSRYVKKIEIATLKTLKSYVRRVVCIGLYIQKV